MQNTPTAHQEHILSSLVPAACTMAEAVEHVLSGGVLLHDAIGTFERRAEETPPDKRAALIQQEPRGIGPVADAYVCAIAEHLSGLWLLDAPRWCLDPWTRRLPEPFFIHGHSTAARWLAQRTSPFAFRRRNLFIPAELLRLTPEPRWPYSLREWWLMPVESTDTGLPMTTFVRVSRQALPPGWPVLVVLGHKHTHRFAEGTPVVEFGAETCQLSGWPIRPKLLHHLSTWGSANFDLLRDLTEGRVDPLMPPQSFTRVAEPEPAVASKS